MDTSKRIKRIIPQSTAGCKEISFRFKIYFDKYIIQGESKKSVISKNMAITTLKSIRKGKVDVFWKNQLKCCRIGTKNFKIGGKMA